MKHEVVMMFGKCPFCHEPCGEDHCAYNEDKCSNDSEDEKKEKEDKDQ